MDSQGTTVESEGSEFPPLFPEELWYEVLLRYGLYVGAAFQLICILAVIVLPPLKEGSDNSAGVNISLYYIMLQYRIVHNKIHNIQYVVYRIY